VYPPYIEGEGQGLGERQGAAQSQPGSLQSLDTPQEDQWGTFPPPMASSEIKWQPERDYANAASSHEVKGITLRDDVLHVKTGTPIRPTPKGWVVAQPTERPLAFAASHYTAGENCTAWRAITLETYKKQFRPSYRYAILEIDVYGNIHLVPDKMGPYIALSETQILLDAALWLPLSPELLMPRPAPTPVAVVTENPSIPRAGKEIPDDEYVRPGDTF
jgi:hypothetical protein